MSTPSPASNRTELVESTLSPKSLRYAPVPAVGSDVVSRKSSPPIAETPDTVLPTYNFRSNTLTAISPTSSDEGTASAVSERLILIIDAIIALL